MLVYPTGPTVCLNDIKRTKKALEQYLLFVKRKRKGQEFSVVNLKTPDEKDKCSA